MALVRQSPPGCFAWPRARNHCSRRARTNDQSVNPPTEHPPNRCNDQELKDPKAPWSHEGMYCNLLLTAQVILIRNATH
jgi:hypothetical protein